MAVDGFSEQQVDYHLVLLRDAGFIGAKRGLSGDWSISALTWEGHEFLDAVRDDGTWKKTKASAGKVGSWSVSMLGDIAKAIGKAEVKRLTGLDI